MSRRAATLFEKMWRDHVVETRPDGSCLLYIDRHLLYEITSPQAFAALRTAGRAVRRPELSLAVADHGVPTSGPRDHGDAPAAADGIRAQIRALATNCRAAGIPYLPLDDRRQGIVHVVGPEQGFTLPGATIVCGDSHTSTRGAFGALAFGIGTSDVEYVLATQTLVMRPLKPMRVAIEGALPAGVAAKNVALALIGRIGAGGATGHVIEYAGSTVRAFSMEERMTLCNLSIEAGARAGLIAPDETTFEWLKDRPMAPQGCRLWERAVADWRALASDPGAAFDGETRIDAEALAPQVTWGTSPEHVCPVTGRVPDPGEASDGVRAAAWRRALDYMDLTPGTTLAGIRIDRVFIDSCTNARLSDLRAAADVVRWSAGGRVAPHVEALVVPGSGLVKEAAEAEGLDRVFVEAGFRWGEPGCSMCVAVNGDRVGPGQRCVSTSNRNFEGRQGPRARTHLASPATTTASAIAGRIADVREILS